MHSRKTLFWKQVVSTVLYMFTLWLYQCRLWSVEWSRVQSVECEDSQVLSGECSV